MREPKHRSDLKGKYRLMNAAKVLTTMASFDSVADAVAWATWNNFGEKNYSYEIVENPRGLNSYCDF